MRVRLTATKHQQNMVKYDSKVVCLSKGEIYALNIKFKNEDNIVLAISKELEQCITEAIAHYHQTAREKAIRFSMRYDETFVTHAFIGNEGVGILIGNTDPTTETAMIVKGIDQHIYLNLKGDFERIGEALFRA